MAWNISCITGPSCGESTEDRWIPSHRTSDAELLYFTLVWTRLNKVFINQSTWRWLESRWRSCDGRIRIVDAPLTGIGNGTSCICNKHLTSWIGWKIVLFLARENVGLLTHRFQCVLQSAILKPRLTDGNKLMQDKWISHADHARLMCIPYRLAWPMFFGINHSCMFSASVLTIRHGLTPNNYLT